MKIEINMYKTPHYKRKWLQEVIHFDSDLLWKYQGLRYLNSSHRHCSDKKTTPLSAKANSLGRKRYIALRLFDKTTEELWQGKGGAAHDPIETFNPKNKKDRHCSKPITKTLSRQYFQKASAHDVLPRKGQSNVPQPSSDAQRHGETSSQPSAVDWCLWR